MDLDTILRKHRDSEGPLLPILRDIQAAFGCISEAHKREVAQALNLTRAEVHGVASFYHDLRDAPADRPIIRLCHAEACQARGGRALVAAAERIADGRVLTEAVYCLGLCAVGPSAIVGDEIHARLTPAKLAALIEKAAA